MIRTNFLYIINILIFILTQTVFAQEYVDQHIDMDGHIIEGYYDVLSYQPENSISNIHYSNSFEKGYYYTNTGEKFKGYILFENKKIFYKEKINDSKKRIKAEDISSVILGVDSFFQTTNFYIKNNYKTKPELVQYITEFNGYEIAKHYHFTSSFGQSNEYRTPIIEEFLIRKKDSIKWDNFQEWPSIKEKIGSYFGYIPYVKSKIESNSFKYEDLFGIIKMAEYFDKFENKKPIYYDRYWQETAIKSRKVYTAKIVSIKEGYWTFEYYKGNTLLYSIQYASFYPFVKNGLLKAYYSNGYLRQVTQYIDNKIKDVKTYTENGQLIKHYKYKKEEHPRSFKILKSIKYSFINEELLKENLNERGLNETCKDSTIISSTYNKTLDGHLIHQVLKPYDDINIKPLRKKFEYFTTGRFYPNAIQDNAQGTILVSIVLDSKGYIIKAKQLNKLHPEIDNLLHDFFRREVLKTSQYALKLRPYKINKVKQYCEFVVPFQFGINRFYREPALYYHNHYWFQMQQSNQLHLQQVNQQIINSLR